MPCTFRQSHVIRSEITACARTSSRNPAARCPVAWAQLSYMLCSTNCGHIRERYALPQCREKRTAGISAMAF